MAIQFEKVFAIKADTLMRMQTNFDMTQARPELTTFSSMRFSMLL